MAKGDEPLLGHRHERSPLPHLCHVVAMYSHARMSETLTSLATLGVVLTQGHPQRLVASFGLPFKPPHGSPRWPRHCCCSMKGEKGMPPLGAVPACPPPREAKCAREREAPKTGRRILAAQRHQRHRHRMASHRLGQGTRFESRPSCQTNVPWPNARKPCGKHVVCVCVCAV